MRPPVTGARAVAAGLPAALALTMLAAPAAAASPTTVDAGAAAFARVPASAPPPTCTVHAGDTVSAIANRHGLRTGDVLAWNALSWSSVIRPGDVLRLTPADSAPTVVPTAQVAAYTIVAGDTMSAIARRHDVSLDALLAANGLDRTSIIYPGHTLTLPAAAAPVSAAPAPAPAPAPAGTYTVVAGDTMSAIAQRSGVSTDTLLAANGLTRASIIYPGQNVIIPAATAPASAPVPATTTATALDAEQSANARVIVAVGRSLGVPDLGIAIALATAMQESSLRNLSYGPDDSLGLFQQRPSTGWGTDAEVQDPQRAARAFFGGPGDPNGSRTRGLLDIPGWQDLGFAAAAQAVQISAYPDRYGVWEQSSYAWLATFG